MINVFKIDDNNFIIQIDHISSKHKVFFSDSFYKKFKKNETKENLIKESFEFLLERESKSSILKEFNLEIIQKFFPEYKSQFLI